MTETNGASSLALLIRLKDKREYLVPQDNLLQLIEFTKTFDAEIYRVSLKGRSESVLRLDQLPEALCDMHYRLDANYTDLGRVVPLGNKPPVENKVPPPITVEHTRQTVRHRRAAMRQQIRERLLSGEVVCLRELCEEFEDQSFSRSTMTNHLAAVRNQLTEEGFNVRRVGVGSYQVNAGGMWVNGLNPVSPPLYYSFTPAIGTATSNPSATIISSGETAITNDMTNVTINWNTERMPHREFLERLR